MPNWTYNEIVCKKNIGDKILEKTENGYSFDFNKLIPMPKSLNVTAGNIEEKAVASYYLSLSKKEQLELQKILYEKNYWNRYKFAIADFDIAPELLTKFEKNFVKEKYPNNYKKFDNPRDLGKQYIENIKKYNYSNWYEWCYKNCGTKWNVGENAEVEYNKNNDEYIICFCTAWSVPVEIVNKFSELCKDGELYWKYVDDDCDGDHCITKEKGKLIHSITSNKEITFEERI